MFIDIIQNLKKLKILVIDNVVLRGEELIGDPFNSKTSTIHAGRLESIRLSYCLFRGAGLTPLNRFLTFFFRSCPYLKSVSLLTWSWYYQFGFRENQLLHYVRLDLPACRYYSFHHEFGKRWRNIDDNIIEDDDPNTLDDDYDDDEQQEIPPYYLNLAWNTKKKIQLSEATL